MKKNTLSIVALFALSASSMLSAQQIIQLGGEATRLDRLDAATGDADDLAWQTQIGANEIIQWNGLRRDDQQQFPTGSNINRWAGLGNTGVTPQPTGILNSGITTLSATLLDIQSGVAGTPNVNATGLPNILGVDVNAGTNAQFNANNGETITFSFNEDVVLLQMIGTGMDFPLERWGVDIGDNGTYDYEWNRNTPGDNAGSTGFTVGSGTVTAATFDTGNRYVASFEVDGIFIAQGTEITIEALQGNMNLHGLVVQTVPEPSAFAMLAGVTALGWVMVRRRRS